MQIAKVVALAGLVLAGPCTATAETPFTGKFSGTGRACSGGLFVRTQTIEWNSSFSVCRPARYDVLEKDLRKDHGRIVFRFKTRSRQCLYEVIEAEQVGTYGWDVRGYQSLASYRKRALPGWSNSSLTERQILSCPMTRLD
ncbi:hypothetical protein [Variovorax boronicumulans]|uniref:hypothetical protein n=1 Tax=Variovorax boronicumulans TaxID=436515 RepID=UPI003390A834